jgi:hypothetical protein
MVERTTSRLRKRSFRKSTSVTGSYSVRLGPRKGVEACLVTSGRTPGRSRRRRSLTTQPRSILSKARWSKFLNPMYVSHKAYHSGVGDVISGSLFVQREKRERAFHISTMPSSHMNLLLYKQPTALTFAPQVYMDAMIRSQGYSTRKLKTLQRMYYNKPTPLQKESCDVYLINAGKALTMIYWPLRWRWVSHSALAATTTPNLLSTWFPVPASKMPPDSDCLIIAATNRSPMTMVICLYRTVAGLRIKMGHSQALFPGLEVLLSFPPVVEVADTTDPYCTAHAPQPRTHVLLYQN